MIIDRLLTYLAPHTCLGCAAEGSLLCTTCLLGLPAADSRCFSCHRLVDGFVTCATCSPQTALDYLVAATRYVGLAKDLVGQLKFQSAKSAAVEMAACLVARHQFDPQAILVPVPTATSRVRARSYDQAEVLARSLSRLTGLPYTPVLRRLGQAHQVGSSRHERLAQLENAYRLVRPKLIADRHVILVDDVATTGATLRAAAQIIAQAGAARVSAAVFAQA